MTSQPVTFALPDLQATLDLGATLAARLKAGDTVFLIGDLGAGKTTLARGLIGAACEAEDVPSPTYTIIQSYETRNGAELLHADLYRIEDMADLDELGLEDAFDAAIVLVEWPDRLADRAPTRRLEIHFEASGSGRIARIITHGDWGDRLVGL